MRLGLAKIFNAAVGMRRRRAQIFCSSPHFTQEQKPRPKEEVLGCEGQKVPQSPKPQKRKSNEKVALGVDPKVTKK